MSKQNLDHLKSTLYSQIEKMDNEVALQMLQEAVTSYSSPQNDILDELTPEQFQRLQDSIKQADAGKPFTNEEVKQKVKEWLSK